MSYVDRRFFTAKRGWTTNSLSMALSTYLTLTKEEYNQILDETRLMIKITLKYISINTIAKSFNVDNRTIVKILRWNENSKYRKPYERLLKEIHEELKLDFAKSNF